MAVYPKSFFEKNEPIEGGLCFVIMSLSPESDSIYKMAIKPTVEALGMKCVRIDNIYAGQPIRTAILSTLKKAEFVIVDITKKDPNVFYELGLAHATKDNVIIISQAPEDIPFDLNFARFIVYDNTTPGIENLKVKLEKEIEMLKRKPAFPEDELFMDKESLPKAAYKSYFNVNHYRSLLTQILNERHILEQGRVFEELVAYLLNNIGFKVTAKESASNAHNPDMRIDMVVWNESDIPKFQIFGNPIVIECKLRDIDAVHIQQYITYLTSTGLTTGFLFSAGQFSADAISQALKASSRRIYIILFDMTELKEISFGQDFINKIEDKIRETARFFLQD